MNLCLMRCVSFANYHERNPVERSLSFHPGTAWHFRRGRSLNITKALRRSWAGLQQTQDFARLFSVPGGGGCPGFVTNAGDFKALEAMQEWVEKGKAPEQIIYSHREAGGMSAGMGSPGKSIAPGRYAHIPRCRNIREAAISMMPPILPALIRVNKPGAFFFRNMWVGASAPTRIANGPDRHNPIRNRIRQIDGRGCGHSPVDLT